MRMFLTPKWLVSHVFVLSMIVLLMILGFWQLDRLDQRKAENVEVRAAIEAEPIALRDALADPQQHAMVIVQGEYIDDASFLVANRTFESRAGSWLATPVRLDDGGIVVVGRGWVPRSWAADQDLREIETPTGPIEILGRLQESVGGGRAGGGSVSRLPEFSRMDLDQLDGFVGEELGDYWVQLVDQAPPLGELPVPVPPPGLDEGPHLSYAFQWFFFSTATIVAYGLILRKVRRERAIDAVDEIEA